jgi:hypothetical protein
MNIDYILDGFNRREVAFLLVGGMNFMLRHTPTLTFDLDLWIEDIPANLARCEQALAELDAAWGASEADWGPVARRAPGWLGAQSVFCLTSPHGAIDIFRELRGLADWQTCRARAVPVITATGVQCYGLADEDMLLSQLALDPAEQKPDRIRVLQAALKGKACFL